MTKDDIIKIASEAYIYADLHHEKHGNWLEAKRHQFANLVAAAEREACAKVCEEPGWNAANWCAKAIRARGEA
jgi:hypothetical protein